MLYHPLLDTYIAVVESGSFTQAAQQCYISSTAIMRQMNQLEQLVNCKLFDRTYHGIELTMQGDLLYHEALRLKREDHDFLEKLAAQQDKRHYTIRVAASYMEPASRLMEIWQPLAKEHTEFQLSIVPFTEHRDAPHYLLHALNRQIDLFLGCYTNEEYINKAKHYHLCDVPFTLSMSRSHPLADKKIIHLDDLEGQTIMIGRSTSQYVQNVRHFLMQRKNIRIESVAAFYDIDVFNQCAAKEALLLSLPHWQQVHPGLVTKPVDWPFCNRLLLFYHPHAPYEVKRFVRLIEDYYQARGGFQLNE